MLRRVKPICPRFDNIGGLLQSALAKIAGPGAAALATSAESAPEMVQKLAKAPALRGVATRAQVESPTVLPAAGKAPSAKPALKYIAE